MEVGYEDGHRPALYRYLDTNGDGTGTKQCIGNHSGGASFYIQPPDGEVYVLERMIVMIEDGAGWRADRYGDLSSALTNGIRVWFRSDKKDDIDLTDGIGIKTNAGWSRVCYDVNPSSFGSGNDFLGVRWTFSKAGYPIRLDAAFNERLAVEVEDDFSGLVEHTFMVQGYLG
jgi:hypothetical protein